MEKYLITGGLGFVGNYLGEYLKSLNHLVVQTDLKKDLGVYLDVCDKSSINDVLKTHKPTNIIHLAGFSSVKKSFEDPELCMKINALGTRNLLESVRENISDAKILIISSSEVYGIPEYLPIDEKHPLKGTNPYAKSRIAQEKIIADEFKDLNIVISRSFNHTGPNQPLGMVLPDFSSQIAQIVKKKQDNVIYVGNLSAERDFLDVRDVVRAYYLLSKGVFKSKIFNVCSGTPIKIITILEKLIEFSNLKIQIKEDPLKLRPVDVKKYYGSNEILLKETGWKPEISFEKTIKDTLDYWIENTY